MSITPASHVRIGLAVLAVIVASGAVVLWQTTGYARWSAANGSRLLPGTSVGGRNLRGKTLAEGAVAVESESASLVGTVTVTVAGKAYEVPAAEMGVSSDAADVEGKLSGSLYTPSYAGYVLSQVGQDPYRGLSGQAFTVKLSADASGVLAAAKRVKAAAGVAARDETLGCSRAGRLAVRPGQAGLAVYQDALVSGLTDAATDPKHRSIAATVATVPFKSLSGRAIVVDQSRRTVTLYDVPSLAVVKRYRCAVGQRAWPTPNGDFRVVSKQKNASWVNPHSAWSSGMPDVIGPGPSNPMGVRKIGINFPGVYLHGVPASEFSSIGTAASHGCMRMLPSSVADLYPRVSIGTPVFIRP